MQWYLTTPEGQEYAVDHIDYSLQRFYEVETPRPSECTLTIPRDTPALEKQWLRAEEDGTTVFLGFVSRRPTLGGVNQTLEGRGVEALLWHRPCPKLTYSANDTTINHIFASGAPWMDDTGAYWQPGLLNAANSLIPPGWIATEFLNPIPPGLEQGIVHGPRWYPTYANDVVKFRYCGTSSCFGTNPIYHDWHRIEEQTSYAACTASANPSVYRDDTDMWMHLPRGSDIYAADFGFNYGNLFCQNAFDTRVRRGTIDLASTLITDPIVVGPDSMIGDVLGNIATIHKQKIRFRYEKVDGVYYCYMDVVDDFDDWGTVDIYESECSKIDFQADSELHPDALVGLGYGDRLFQAAYSVFNTRPGTAFVSQIETFDNSMEDYTGNLAPYVTLKWDEYREKDIIEVTSDQYDHVFPGQSVTLHIENEADKTYQVASISQSATAASMLSLGKRSKDITDSVRAMQNASQVYKIDDLSEVGSVSFNGVIGVGDWGHACVPYVSDPIYLPAYADYSQYNPATILDISISLRQDCYTPADISALLYAEISTDGITYTRIDNSETIQYLLTEPVSINIMGNVTWSSKNYIKVYCVLNGGWPAERRTLENVLAGITAPIDGTTRNRDDYYHGVWGRYLNKEHYAYLVLLESDYYAYQIQKPGEADINATWYLGDGDTVAKDLFYAFVTASGRSKSIVLAEVLTPATDYDRTNPQYYNGFWGRTLGSGHYALVIKLETGDKYAYQIQPPGTWVPTNPWSIGTSQQAADALYTSSASGTRTAADIKAEIDTPQSTPDHVAWSPLANYLYDVRGYDVAAYPIAHIIELSENGATATEKRFAYRIETASATFTDWKVDELNGESICAALLEDYTLTDLRKQSDIRTDISNLVFLEPETYSWQAYGYEPPATPSFTIIQVSNAPQVLAYKRKWVDDEEGDWAIDLTSGAGIASQIMPDVKYYDISVNCSVVRRRWIT